MNRHSGNHGRGAALVAGASAAFAVAVGLVITIRPRLLLDPDPSWALARLLLTLFVFAAAAGAGVAASAALHLWGRTRAVAERLPGLPLSAGVLLCLAAAALLLGTAARFAALDRLPAPLWVDDLSLIAPALSLHGNARDFADPIRAVPFGLPRPYGSVGVLYLELYRWSLLLFGTTVFGVRFLSAAAGVLSIATAIALARALLPRGGGTLAGLAIAGMRWHLILSRWGWNAIVLVPLLDLAALLLLRARRRRSVAAVAAARPPRRDRGAHLPGGLGCAGGSGGVPGLAWFGSDAPVAPRRFEPLRCDVPPGGFSSLLAWPRKDALLPARRAAQRARGNPTPAFVRAPLLLCRDRAGRSLVPRRPFAVERLAGQVAPGLDPRHLRRRGAGALALSPAGRTLRLPAGACRRGVCLDGRLGHGNAAERLPRRLSDDSDGRSGGRGALSLLALLSGRARRAGAIATVGLLAISGTLAARDLFLRWGPMLEAWEGYQGRDNLVASSIMRWQRYGPVRVDPRLSRILANETTFYVDLLVRYRLDAGGPAPLGPSPLRGDGPHRSFRLIPATQVPPAGERVVEVVRDGRGTKWALMLGVRR